jgi:hypothetical protein
MGVEGTPLGETDPRASWPGDPGAGGLAQHAGVSALWYGPFQFVTLWALALLWRGRGLDAAVQVVRRVPLGLWAVVAVAGLVLWGALGWQYHRISQIYTPVAQRMPSMRDNPWRRCKAVGCSKMPLPLPS